jgi:Xaa-Pro dipeptidase
MSLEHLRPFPPEELDGRLRRLREKMSEKGLKAAVIIGPENIYYLTGVDHYGYFFQYFLLAPLEGEPVLICRRMEQVTMGIMLQGARFHGHLDHEHPSDYLIGEIKAQGLDRARVGIEKHCLFGPLENYERLFAGLPQVQWESFSNVVDEMRRVKSPLELDYLRRAGAISSAMARAAVEACRAGAAENEIAGEICKAMCSMGGNAPGFPPFIRSTPTMGMEHGGWTTRKLENKDIMFMEMSGCYKHYHAPIGRLVFLGEMPKETDFIAKVTIDAFNAVLENLKDGHTAAEVYEKWQAVVDKAGLSHYTRHHCGYVVGVGFPPTWTGGGQVVGLRRHSDMVLKKGMTFHLLSWLVGSGRGDYLVTNAAAVGGTRGENLIDYPMEPILIK